MLRTILKDIKPGCDIISFVFLNDYSDCPERSILRNFQSGCG